jgi:hypothetical protein
MNRYMIVTPVQTYTRPSLEQAFLLAAERGYDSVIFMNDQRVARWTPAMGRITYPR